MLREVAMVHVCIVAVVASLLPVLVAVSRVLRAKKPNRLARRPVLIAKPGVIPLEARACALLVKWVAMDHLQI